MQHLTLLALPGSMTTSISLPLEILNAANEQARVRNRRQARINTAIVSNTQGPIITAGGLPLHASATFDAVEQTDVLILPSLWRNPLTMLKQYPQLLPWLQKMSAQNSLVCAVGTSSYFLAEAGLLNGKPATTHWYYCDQFAKRYPKVNLKRQYLITQAENIYCAGSVNSIADLMVHLVSQFYGQALARQVEAQFSPEIRRPFEDHAYAETDSSPHHDETIVEAQEWLMENYHKPINIQHLSKSLGLSNRTFNRRFKQALGITTSEFLQKQRLTVAKDLLRTSNLSINEIAAQTGHQDSSYFCARFKAFMGQTPLAYRKSVRGKLFTMI